MTEQAPTLPRCNAMLSAAVDGVGFTETCIRICSEWPALGRPTTVYATRARSTHESGLIRPAVPSALSALPHRAVKWWAEPSSAKRCGATDLSTGDLAYVWPNAPNEFVAMAKERGATIVVENINTFTGYAKRILDAAYAELDSPPRPLIDQAKIDRELDRLALADYVFAPNAHVEASLAETGISNFVVLPTSYGAYLPSDGDTAARRRRAGRPLRFLFTGRVCVGKGTHVLLDAWRSAGIPGELVLCGDVEQLILDRYRDTLTDPRISLRGYVSDIDREYAEADVFVFPSLDEGGPQVCYEAAAHALPQITTNVGGGRIAEDGRNALVVEPSDVASLAQSMQRLAEDAELREVLGANAASDAVAFSWHNVARQRNEALHRAGV